MYNFWLGFTLISLFVGFFVSMALLSHYKSNWPSLISFGIAMILVICGIVGALITRPESEEKVYKYCPYCGEEVHWKEIK